MTWVEIKRGGEEGEERRGDERKLLERKRSSERH